MGSLGPEQFSVDFVVRVPADEAPPAAWTILGIATEAVGNDARGVPVWFPEAGVQSVSRHMRGARRLSQHDRIGAVRMPPDVSRAVLSRLGVSTLGELSDAGYVTSQQFRAAFQAVSGNAVGFAQREDVVQLRCRPHGNDEPCYEPPCG